MLEPLGGSATEDALAYCRVTQTEIHEAVLPIFTQNQILKLSMPAKKIVEVSTLFSLELNQQQAGVS